MVEDIKENSRRELNSIPETVFKKCFDDCIISWRKCIVSEGAYFETATTFNQSHFLLTEAGRSFLFKEWELVVDEEDKEQANNVDSNKEMEKLNKLLQEKKGGSLNNIDDNELEQYAQSLPNDKVFNKFSKRIARHPDQVLRYDRGGTPLWITGCANNEPVIIPNCQYCNGERQFEFQVMPQLLNFINVGLELSSIDWGILAVYTCKNSCNSAPAYKKEFVIKQDLN